MFYSIPSSALALFFSLLISPPVLSDEVKPFNPPPLIFSKEQIRDWTNEEIQVAGRILPVNLMDTERWSTYVNYNHFVPLTLEGVPADYIFDYNWVENEDPRRFLPSAEVTETGEFVFWWNRCNYYEETEEKCRKFIRMAVSHEGYHHDQWQRIAIVVLTLLGEKVDQNNPPKTVTDLEVIDGAGVRA